MRRPTDQHPNTANTLTCVLLIFSVCTSSAVADEGLFVIGSSYDDSRGRFAPQASALGGVTAMSKWPVAETYLYFPATGQKQRNNLIPPTDVGKRVLNWQGYGSTAGRLILATRSKVDHLTRSSKPVFEMRLVSPFRNLPFTQTSPFYRLAEGKADTAVVLSPAWWNIDNGLAPYFYSLQWAPDGSAFTMINQQGQLGKAGQNEVRHLGGGLLYSFAGSPRFRTGTVAKTLMRLGPQAGETRQFEFPAKRGKYAAGDFARKGKRSFAQFGDLSPVHLSPNGRYVARVEQVNKPLPDFFNGNKQILKLGRLALPGQVYEVDRSNRLVRGGGKTRWRDERDQSSLIPIGWSQESDYFYFVELKVNRKAYDVKDKGGAWVNTAGRGLPEPAGANTYVIESVVLWRSNTDGLVRKVMDLEHVPSLHHLARRMSPTLVAEKKKYVAFWGTPRSRFGDAADYKKWSRWYPGQRARDLHLVVADTTAKSEKRVFHSGTVFDYASFINTQDHDTNNPKPALDDKKLPQYFLKFKTAPRLKSRAGYGSWISMPFEGKATDLEGHHKKFTICVRAVDAKGSLLPSVDSEFRGSKGEALIKFPLFPSFTIEGTHFNNSDLSIDLSWLDIFGASPQRIRLRLSLEREGIEVVKTLSDPIDIPAEKMPRVFFADRSIKREKDAKTGELVLRYRATAHIRGSRGKTIKLQSRAFRRTDEGKFDRTIAKDTSWLDDSGAVSLTKTYRVNKDVATIKIDNTIPLRVFAADKKRKYLLCDFHAVDRDARKTLSSMPASAVTIWP